MRQERVRKIKKRLLIVFIVLLSVFIGLLLFISTIAKYLVEKYDVDYIGREITLDRAYVNPVTGYMHFRNLKFYENKDTGIFISMKGLEANLSIFKLLSGTYEISDMLIDGPRGNVIQTGKDFNFKDLIERFKPKSPREPAMEKLHLNILNIKMLNGDFIFNETITPINYTIRKFNFESPGLYWNVDTIAARFSFYSDTGVGYIEAVSTYNLKNNDYRISTIVRKFDLKIIGEYMKDLSNYGSFRATMDADVEASGNLLDAENLDARGSVSFNDFHLGISKEEDYAAFDRLAITVIALSPKNHQYLFDSVLLDHPYLKYEKYDHLDNLQMMFGRDGANISSAGSGPGRFNLVIEIGNYIKLLARNFLSSDYRVNQLDIVKGNVRYSDFSINEEFTVACNPLTVHADSIDKNRKRSEVTFKTGILPYGEANIWLSINPQDSSDFDMKYHLQKLPLSMFNPYLVTQTSFPLNRGTLESKGVWHVRNGEINSDNHLVIIDPRLGQRIRNKDSRWLPVPLMFAFLKENGNVIDYEIPIQGDLKNPKFHLRDVLFDILSNIFTKPVTIPYRRTVNKAERNIEQSLSLNWGMREAKLLPSQEKFLEKMAEFMGGHPEAILSVYPQNYEWKEREGILFFESKKKYFISIQKNQHYSFSEKDSVFVNKMSIKDIGFLNYLDHQTGSKMLFTVQQKCLKLMNAAFISEKYRKLNADRIKVVTAFFKAEKARNQIKIYHGETIVPYNGFSNYRMVYKGEMPEMLKNAYMQMDEFNDEFPRNRYSKERKGIREKLKN